MPEPELADVHINTETLAFIGVQVHFKRPSSLVAPVELLGSLAFLGDVAVYRPLPPAPTSKGALSSYDYTASLRGPEIGSSSTYSLADPKSSELVKKKPGPAFSRLWAMRKAPDYYPLYEAIDALIEAVLELNRRGGGP